MSDGRIIYLDNAATTQVHPDVLAAMMPYFGPEYGNPSSTHALGRAARQAVDEARATVASVLNCEPSEIVFTSCATESNNLAMKGIMHAGGGTGHLITTAIEHHAVLHTAEQLEREGYDVTVLPVGSDGITDPDDVQKALRPDTRLISVMYANNEIGTIQPLQEIVGVARDAGVRVHTDAVQAAGALSLDVRRLGVDALSLAGHKFRAPKGVGLLYLRDGIRVEPQMQGGGQESGRRSGTENLPYIVGIATALERVDRLRDQHGDLERRLRERLLAGLAMSGLDWRLNGHATRRLPNNTHVSFRGIEAQSILMGLDMRGICASSGSACVSAALEPSHVLQAIGVPGEYVYGSLRLTTNEETTNEDIDYLLDVLVPLVNRLQAISPVVI